MGVDPVWRLMLRFSGPAIISMTVASTYSLVDAVFVGRLGTTALAAMTATYPAVMALVAIASGTAIGATSLIARSLGAGDDEASDRAAAVAITLGFLISAIVAVVCLPLLDPVLGALGADQAVLRQARDYLSILLVFYIFQYFSIVLASVIRADGSPVFASSVSICAGVLNVALDPVFIFGLGPVPSLGIRGAAIATVISQAAGTAVLPDGSSGARPDMRFDPASSCHVGESSVGSIVWAGRRSSERGPNSWRRALSSAPRPRSA